MNSFGFFIFLFLRILISTLFQQHNQERRKQGKSMSRIQRILYAMIIMLCKVTKKKTQKIYGEVLLECVGNVKKLEGIEVGEEHKNIKENDVFFKQRF